MAMSAAAVFAGTTTKTWNVIASADGDTGTLVIAHGFGAAPALVMLTPLLTAGTLSGWSAAIDATNITLTKGTTAAGSGNAGAQLRVIAQIPHSLMG